MPPQVSGCVCVPALRPAFPGGDPSPGLPCRPPPFSLWALAEAGVTNTSASPSPPQTPEASEHLAHVLGSQAQPLPGASSNPSPWTPGPHLASGMVLTAPSLPEGQGALVAQGLTPNSFLLRRPRGQAARHSVPGCRGLLLAVSTPAPLSLG